MLHRHSIWTLVLLAAALVAVQAGPPNPDFTGLRLGNRWTYSDGTTVSIDRVDSTPEGWMYRRVAMEKCPLCKDKMPVADTSWQLVRGDSVFQAGLETGGKWQLAILLPPAAGLRWVTDAVEHDTLGWVATSSVRVPAGAFKGCWKIRSSDSLDLWVHQKAGVVRIKPGTAFIDLQSFQAGNI